MEIPKDLYDELTKYADDATILKMIQVNKKYNDPVFFEKIIKRKYPLLEIFKRPGESMKMLYLRMIHYILKLEEDFNVKYHPVPSFNPEIFYNNLRLLSEMFYRLKNLPFLGDDDNFINIKLRDIPNNSRPVNVGEITIVRTVNGNFNLTKNKNSIETYNVTSNRMFTIKQVSDLLIDEYPLTMDLYNQGESELQFILDGVRFSF